MTISDFRAKAVKAVAMYAIIGLSATAATAETSLDAGNAAPVVKTSAAGQGSAHYDWLRPVSGTAPTKVAAVSPVGSGKWICSPAGFGSKSKCFRR